MVDIGNWLGSGGGTPAATEAQRAGLAYRRIQDKPTSVAFRTPAGSTLDAQTVRVENDSTASATMSTAGKSAARRVVVFGIRNHDLFTDTDVAEGYRFILAGDEYRVQSIVLTLGEVQAMCEAVSG